MNQDELTALIDKTATLMEMFERRTHAIDERQQVLSQQLQGLAQLLPATVRHSADTALQALPAQVLGKIQSGLDQPVNDYEQRLREAGALLRDGSQTLVLQLQRLERLHKQLVWKVVGVTAICLLLLVVSGTWLSSHYYNAVREHQVAADLLKVYNVADVMICEQRLCVNVDSKGKRYGDQGQYLPARPR